MFTPGGLKHSPGLISFPFLSVDCEIEKVDLVFLMDGSNSIHPDDFQKMKGFLVSVVQDFDVSLNRVRIGVAQFSDSYRSEFLLGTFTGEREISTQIEGIQQIFGYTHIGDALRKVKYYFQPDTGSRIDHLALKTDWCALPCARGTAFPAPSFPLFLTVLFLRLKPPPFTLPCSLASCLFHSCLGSHVGEIL